MFSNNAGARIYLSFMNYRKVEAWMNISLSRIYRLLVFTIRLSRAWEIDDVSLSTTLRFSNYSRNLNFNWWRSLFAKDISLCRNESFVSVRHSFIKTKSIEEGLLSRFWALFNVESLFDFPCISPLLLSAVVAGTFLKKHVLMLCENARENTNIIFGWTVNGFA